MHTFQSIKEFIHDLNFSKDLLTEMFEKRKSLNYRYEDAVALLEDETKVERLIDKEIIIRNGAFLEINDTLLVFFENVLDVNEEVNTAYIEEHLKLIEESIEYFLLEDNESRRYRYLKVVKNTLRNIGVVGIRNVVDLDRNIENTFKTEPNYKIKIRKLENYDQKRQDIMMLIDKAEQLVQEQHKTFFIKAMDDQLNSVIVALKIQLHDARHNLIEIQKQVINFLNQVKQHNRFVEKLRKVKYLKDQFELKEKSDIEQILFKDHALIYESRSSSSLKIDLDILEEDTVYELIDAIHRKQKRQTKQEMSIAPAIDNTFFDQDTEQMEFIRYDEMIHNFKASRYHLWDFMHHYSYDQPVTTEQKVHYFCQMVSLYEEELRFTEECVSFEGLELAIVYPN
ncbi:hypothetical protein K5X82_00155 [Halosquirtibacter xylanolyticus]|uniref:hypothetical protein n=1 Tax=Halosquirtibacter xylanolyticus TaxID=3374599 RepID=UPI0037487334|nr:hypothetical protein K5X82_00155 [Prolixibacteraceae bacterium]